MTLDGRSAVRLAEHLSYMRNEALCRGDRDRGLRLQAVLRLLRHAARVMEGRA